jgi:hypothetical protein
MNIGYNTQAQVVYEKKREKIKKKIKKPSGRLHHFIIKFIVAGFFSLLLLFLHTNKQQSLKKLFIWRKNLRNWFFVLRINFSSVRRKQMQRKE